MGISTQPIEPNIMFPLANFGFTQGSITFSHDGGAPDSYNDLDYHRENLIPVNLYVIWLRRFIGYVLNMPPSISDELSSQLKKTISPEDLSLVRLNINNLCPSLPSACPIKAELLSEKTGQVIACMPSTIFLQDERVFQEVQPTSKRFEESNVLDRKDVLGQALLGMVGSIASFQDKQSCQHFLYALDTTWGGVGPGCIYPISAHFRPTSSAGLNWRNCSQLPEFAFYAKCKAEQAIGTSEK